MYFSLGAHPAFNCPLEEGEKYEDYHLKFEQTEYLKRWNLDASGQIAEEGKLVMDNCQIMPLSSHLFVNDALIFKELKSHQVSLCSANREIIKVKFQDFTSLGLWAKPKAPFICIEPWLGYADASDSNQQLIEKEALLKLNAQDEFAASYSIEVFDN
jgi:galactose mutarotase-like enzyme